MTADVVFAFAPLFRYSAINEIGIKKVLVKSQVNFKLKRSRLSSEDWFLCRHDVQVHTAASVWESKNGGEGGKTIHHPSYLQGFVPTGFFSL